MRNRRVSNRELSDVRIQDVQRGVRIMEREMKRKPRVKKACSILLALLLVLTLMPSQVAFAEDGHYKNGDICPDCGNVLTVEKASASRHSVHCGFCGYRSYEEHWGFDDHCLCAGCEQICHDYTAYYADKDPTCTELGVICHWYCSRCQKNYGLGETELSDGAWIIPALGHDLVHHDAQAPTCTEYGWDAYDTCSRCEYTTYKEIPALGHDLIHHDAQAATCTDVGWEAYDTCSRCDYTTYKEITALGHDLVHHDAQAATCTEVGWEAYDTCSRCDYTTYVEIPALGHDWGEWQVTTEPEVGKAGERQRTCSHCNETESEPIAALIGYSVTGGGDASWTKGSSGSVTITVKRSEDDASCFGHYVETLIDGSPVTVSAKAGSTVVTINADTLEKLSTGTHTVTVKFDDGQVDTKLTIKAAASPTDPTSPQTGDNSHMALWVSLLCVSGAALAALIITGRKRKARS